MGRDGNCPRLCRMVILPVTALSSSQSPAVVLQTPDYVADFHLLRRSVEVIVRRITALGFGTFVGFIAALGRSLAAVRVYSLNTGHPGELTISRMTHHLHQQPRNGTR